MQTTLTPRNCKTSITAQIHSFKFDLKRDPHDIGKRKHSVGTKLNVHRKLGFFFSPSLSNLQIIIKKLSQIFYPLPCYLKIYASPGIMDIPPNTGHYARLIKENAMAHQHTIHI